MWLAARIVARQFMAIDSAATFGALSNVLLIVILVFLAIYNKYRLLPPNEPRPRFLEDILDCLKAALKYVAGAIAAMFLYYGVISDDVEMMRAAKNQEFQAMINTEEGLAEYRKQHPEEKDNTREQLIQTNVQNVERFVSTQSRILVGTLALVLVSIAYSLLAVFFWRSIVRRL